MRRRPLLVLGLFAMAAVSLLGGCYQSFVGDAPPDSGGRPDVTVIPFDGDVPPFDATVPPFDATVPPFDATLPPLDAMMPLDGGLPFDAIVPSDATVPPRDSGIPRDSGLPPFDSGFPPFDAGLPPLDSGFPPFDAGLPPVDAGTRDAGRDAGPIDSGPPRPALRLSRTTFMSAGDSPAFDVTGASTTELWVRTRETADIATYCTKGDTIAQHMLFGQFAGRYGAGWQVSTNVALVLGPPIRPGEWVHLALTIQPNADGSYRADFYVDGALVGSQPALTGLTFAFNDIPFRCGFVEADVDEIRVWRVARSAASIAGSRNARVSGSSPGLLAYWRLDESGQILFDYTAMGHVGIRGTLTTADPADPVWILDGAI